MPTARATPISTGSFPKPSSGLDIRKGPYWADVGDFENAGNLHISVVDTVPQNIESVTVGSFGYTEVLTLGSTKLGGGNLLYAGEFTGYDGPWTTPDDMKKFSGLLRYSQGTATDGFSLTGMAYANTWNSTDQSGAARLYDGTDRPLWRNSIRPMAATPAASRCRAGWRRPPTTDRGKPTPMSSNTRWICGTTSPGT